MAIRTLTLDIPDEFEIKSGAISSSVWFKDGIPCVSAIIHLRDKARVPRVGEVWLDSGCEEAFLIAHLRGKYITINLSESGVHRSETHNRIARDGAGLHYGYPSVRAWARDAE
jgi:hypothetical protein